MVALWTGSEAGTLGGEERGERERREAGGGAGEETAHRWGGGSGAADGSGRTRAMSRVLLRRAKGGAGLLRPRHLRHVPAERPPQGAGGAPAAKIRYTPVAVFTSPGTEPVPMRPGPRLQRYVAGSGFTSMAL